MTMECRLERVLDIGKMDVFVGEVVGTHINCECLTDGMPDVKKIDPVGFSLNGYYWRLGPGL